MPFEIYKLGIQRTNLYWRGLGCFHRSRRFHRFGVSRRCVAKSRVRLINWMTSTSGNETNDHCLKLITWPAFGSSLFSESWKWKMKQHVHFSFLDRGNKIEFNIHCFAKLKSEKWKIKACVQLSFFRKLTNGKLKFVFNFHFFQWKQTWQFNFYFFSPPEKDILCPRATTDNGETAVDGYNSVLFWVLSVLCWCLAE